MEGSVGALAFREKDDDDQKGLQNAFLPFDLVSLIIAHLPSRELFDLRLLCKAANRRVLLALARRPFFIVQQNSPSTLCHLIPLDVPCSPLPCSFNLAKSSFRLFSGSGNLLCLHRQYALLLDICVCDIFRKCKIVLPPIVHPRFAPLITRRVFSEDVNVESMQVVGFHAAQPTSNTDEEGVLSSGYRVFAASSAYLRVFDSHVNQWSDPVHFPPHLIFSGRIKPPLGFATSDGNLILTFPYKARVLFNYEDQSFHAMDLDFPHPEFEIAGYTASAEIDSSFKLRVRLPHVEECEQSSPESGLVLEGSCKRDLGSTYCGSYSVTIDGVRHKHVYSRNRLRSFCHAYQGKVYALVTERDELRCYTEECIEDCSRDSDEDPELDDLEGCPQPSVSRGGEHEQLCAMISTKCEGKEWHDLHSLDVEKCLLPEEGAIFDCADFFPARSPHKLTLYSAHIDTRDWTMRVSKEANASACLDVFDEEGGKFSLISGCVHAAFGTGA